MSTISKIEAANFHSNPSQSVEDSELNARIKALAEREISWKGPSLPDLLWMHEKHLRILKVLETNTAELPETKKFDMMESMQLTVLDLALDEWEHCYPQSPLLTRDRLNEIADDINSQDPAKKQQALASLKQIKESLRAKTSLSSKEKLKMIVDDINSQDYGKVMQALVALEQIGESLKPLARFELEEMLGDSNLKEKSKSIWECLNIYPNLTIFLEKALLTWSDAALNPEERVNQRKAAEEMIRAVKNGYIISLLGYLDLRDLPPEMGQLPFERLFLPHNQLNALPDFSPDLQVLFLNNNLFDVVPNLSKHRKLTVLNLDNNKIIELPDWILSLSSKCNVYVRDNPFPPGYAEAFQERLRLHRERHPDQGPRVEF